MLEGWHPFCPELENGIPQIIKARIRCALRTISAPKFRLVGGRKRYAGSVKKLTRCYIVAMPGEFEVVCRTKGYAKYLADLLDAGLAREHIINEVKWLKTSGHSISRYRGPALGDPVFFISCGLVVKRFSDPSEADGWAEWYERRRVALGLKREPANPYESYMVFRSQETLDKPLQDRVYDLVRRLTTEHMEPEDAEDL